MEELESERASLAAGFGELLTSFSFSFKLSCDDTLLTFGGLLLSCVSGNIKSNKKIKLIAIQKLNFFTFFANNQTT